MTMFRMMQDKNCCKITNLSIRSGLRHGLLKQMVILSIETKESRFYPIHHPRVKLLNEDNDFEPAVSLQ